MSLLLAVEKFEPCFETEEQLGIAIPPQPKLLTEIENVYPEIDKVAALIAKDPKIGEGVLRVVNSPCIGLSREIVRIEQAVILLGLDSVMNIVNSVLLQLTFGKQLRSAPLKNYWKNTMQTAIAASLLARSFPGIRSDDAFTMGLFHNCAIPLIHEKFHNYLDVIKLSYADSSARIAMIEDHKFGADHATISHLIARAWNLPPSIIAAIRDHHNHKRLACSSRTEDEKHIDRLCALLKLSEHIVKTYSTLGGQIKDYEWEMFKVPILNTLYIDPQILPRLIEDTMRKVLDSDLLYS